MQTMTTNQVLAASLPPQLMLDWAADMLDAAESAANDDLACRVDVPSPDDRRGLELSERAARNYPDSPYLQAEWRRAVAVVRATKGGWRLDNPISRRA